MTKLAQSHLEYAAEVLDYAANLIELAGERILRSHQLAAFTKSETIMASRELIVYTKARNAESRVLVENHSRFLRKLGGGLRAVPFRYLWPTARLQTLML
jgi:hypothetical protein